jgi:NADH:ubiquinone oxidoreductase subunit 6 (subunit J)
MDIMHDRAGYYICWGCLVWVPSVYTSPALFLTEVSIAWSMFQTALPQHMMQVLLYVGDVVHMLVKALMMYLCATSTVFVSAAFSASYSCFGVWCCSTRIGWERR